MREKRRLKGSKEKGATNTVTRGTVSDRMKGFNQFLPLFCDQPIDSCTHSTDQRHTYGNSGTW